VSNLAQGSALTPRSGPRPPVAAPPPAYGSEASVLLTMARDRLAPQMDELVARFYGRLASSPGTAEVLARLTAEERGHLDAHQGRHLLEVLDPAASAQRMALRSRQLGRVHAMVGVELDWYTRAISDVLRDLFAVLRPWPDTDTWSMVHSVVTERFMHDLQGALLGYRDVDASQHQVLTHLTEVIADASTVADLARDALEALSRLDGVVLAFLARLGPDGRFEFEVGAGQEVDAFISRAFEVGSPVITADPDDPAGMGPAGRAWRSGDIERCDSYLADPLMAPWHSWAEAFGWRSSVAVPINDQSGKPHALLTLYARWPGYFAHDSRIAVLRHTKQLIERALIKLEYHPNVASEVRRYADRVEHVWLLRDGAVQMLYQPVVDLPSGRLSKLEALARLRDGERLITPADFLASFGDEELLTLFEIGVDQALDALKLWDRDGVVTGVSVNLPVMCVEDDRYVATVAAALERHRLDPSRLTLELLETGEIGADLGRRRAALDAFKALGVRLAQDDLGSGYSSLLRLRHFEFDDVKIDQHLVRGTELAPRANLQFIQPITHIAHSLGLEVIIEGLEHNGLIEAAVQLGVDAGQGYAIAKPMPAEQVVEWVRRFQLDIFRHRPQTALGALAGHIAWEHRMMALGPDPMNDSLLDTEDCVLTSYLEGRDEDGELTEAHVAVHAAAIGRRGSDEHRAAWERMAQLLGEG
jgi:EAL domain-containing protein (putative c-di-GMP-specific phosphodiesterase class I)